MANLLASRIYWSVGEAERLKGSAPSYPEIIVVYHENFGRLFKNGYLLAFLQNLFREDKLYADKLFKVCSLTGPDGSEARKTFETFSQKFQRYFKGYELNSFMRIVAKPETTVINLRQLMALLNSSDATLWERSKWMFDGHFRFLDGQLNKS